MLDFADKPRLRVLLDHFAAIDDDREGWRVAHPLPEVLLLIVCGTIGGATISRRSSNGVKTTSTFCAVSCPIITAFPARAGCASG